MSRVGGTLFELRRRRNLSVRELALRSGVSHSTISLIERDQTSPSIDTLNAIVEALGGTLSAVFSDLEGPREVSPFCPRSETVEIGNPKAISYKVIGMNHPNRQLLMMHETYALGADTGRALSHAALEGGIVISGAVEVTVATHGRVLIRRFAPLLPIGDWEKGKR